MNQIQNSQEKTFESIKHIDENDAEFWYARELMTVLEYSKWENFEKIINKAIETCKNSNMSVFDHFPDVRKTLKMPKSAEKTIIDYKLSRYACYLIAQNGDSRKKAIALAQTYFAIQTRKQELNEQEYLNLTEDERRLYTRNQTRTHNTYLFDVAKQAGVQNFGKFNNAGYKGLYKETASQIKQRKGLSTNDEILDFMGSEELGANLFRITQTKAKMERENIKGENKACATHFDVGTKVRSAIEDIGGTMPEKLLTPEKGITQLAREIKQKLLQEDNK